MKPRLAGFAWLLVIAVAMSGAAPPPPLVALAPLTGVVASLVQAMLHPLGIEAVRAGGTLYVPGVFGYEITLMRRYLSFAEAGAGWLVVYAPGDGAAAKVAEIARRHGARCAVRYHRLASEDLI